MLSSVIVDFFCDFMQKKDVFFTTIIIFADRVIALPL